MHPSAPADSSVCAERRSGERARHDPVDQDASLQDMYFSNDQTITKRQISRVRSKSAIIRTAAAAKHPTAALNHAASSSPTTVVKPRSTKPPVSGKIKCSSKNKAVKKNNNVPNVPMQSGKTHKRKKRTTQISTAIAAEKNTPTSEKHIQNTLENDVQLHSPELDNTPDSSKTSSSNDCQSLYLQTSTFSSGSQTHLSNSPSTSPLSTSPWVSRPVTWDSAASPIFSDIGAALSADTSLSSPPPKNTLPRCAVVNFRREGDVVKWIPRARENTGGIAAKVHDFDDAFKLEELSSRNFAMAPRYFSSVSAAQIRFDPRREISLSSSSSSRKWAERVRQLSNGTRSVTRQLSVGATGGRMYLGTAISHVKNSQNANMNTARKGSDLSCSVLKGPRLIEESAALNRIFPPAETKENDRDDESTISVKKETKGKIWAMKISAVLQLRQNSPTQDRSKYYPPPKQEVRCNRISLSAADFRAISGPPAWDTRDVKMRKQSLPPMSTLNHDAQLKARRKHSLPRRKIAQDVSSSASTRKYEESAASKSPLTRSLSRFNVVKSPTVKTVARSAAHPSAAPMSSIAQTQSSFMPNSAAWNKSTEKRYTKQKKRGLRGLFGRRRHDELVDPNVGGQLADELDDDSQESYLRRMVSNWHVRRSSLSQKPTMATNGDQYMQFIGRT